MITGIRFKICGLTSLVDADFVDRLGADYLGFILYPRSPRYVPLAQFMAMAPRLPEGRKRVAVLVAPTQEEVAAVVAAGFDRLQIYVEAATPLAEVRAWSQAVTPERLWLAPRLPPGAPLDAAWLPLADTFLLDTYQPTAFGGTGHTGDWPGFAQFRQAYPENTWVLAGGLNPLNVEAALATTGARVVDVNSGVELAPGIKDHTKLRALAVALHRAGTQRQENASSRTTGTMDAMDTPANA